MLTRSLTIALLLAFSVPLFGQGNYEESESYRIKQIQTEWTVTASKLFNAGFDWRSATDNPDGDQWTLDQQKIEIGPQGHCPGCTSDYGFSITFDNVRYGPSTKLVYGQPTAQPNIESQGEAGQQERRNNRLGTTPDEVSINRSFTLENSVESTFAHEFGVDVSTSSETTVGASPYPGVDFEEKLTTTFGTHFTESESQTKAQSQSQTRSVDDKVEVPAGREYIFIFDTQKVTTTVPFHVDGVLDFSITVQFHCRGTDPPDRFNRYVSNQSNPAWARRTNELGATNNCQQPGGHRWYDMSFPGLTEFGQFLHGVNTDWPRMDGWWANAGGEAQALATQLLSEEHRKIVLSGSQTRVGEESVTMTILDVTGCEELSVDDLEETLDGVSGSDAPIPGATLLLSQNTCAASVESRSY